MIRTILILLPVFLTSVFLTSTDANAACREGKFIAKPQADGSVLIVDECQPAAKAPPKTQRPAEKSAAEQAMEKAAEERRSHEITPENLCKIEDSRKKEWLSLRESAEAERNVIRQEELEAKSKEKENEIKSRLKALLGNQEEAPIQGFGVIVDTISGSTTEGIEVTFILPGCEKEFIFLKSYFSLPGKEQKYAPVRKYQSNYESLKSVIRELKDGDRVTLTGTIVAIRPDGKPSLERAFPAKRTIIGGSDWGWIADTRFIVQLMEIKRPTEIEKAHNVNSNPKF